jgi:hypothetical protein
LKSATKSSAGQGEFFGNDSSRAVAQGMWVWKFPQGFEKIRAATLLP